MTLYTAVIYNNIAVIVRYILYLTTTCWLRFWGICHTLMATIGTYIHVISTYTNKNKSSKKYNEMKTLLPKNAKMIKIYQILTWELNWFPWFEGVWGRGGMGKSYVVTLRYTIKLIFFKLIWQHSTQACWHIALISAFGSKEDLYVFQDSMVYTVSSRSSRLHVLKKIQTRKQHLYCTQRRFSQELNYTGSLISNFKY